MRICVLRRDGEDIHNGMAQVTIMLVHEYFGEKTKVYIQPKKEELTQAIAFNIPSSEEPDKIIKFIVRISTINPLYAVKILD